MESLELLQRFGLTGQEARLYLCLYEQGTATGYELAKRTGISRSNTYAALTSLADKGGACLIDGQPARYQAVTVEEFCSNVIRSLSQAQNLLTEQLTPPKPPDSAYLTIQGSRNIRDKIQTLLENARERVYLSMPADRLEEFLPLLEAFILKGKKVVAITDRPVPLEGAVLYFSSRQDASIRMIVDSSQALTGLLDDTGRSSCLYSLQENLVNLLKDSVKNEIRLIQLQEGANP